MFLKSGVFQITPSFEKEGKREGIYLYIWRLVLNLLTLLPNWELLPIVTYFSKVFRED